MNQHEPEPEGAPVCPETLTGEALAEWNRIVPELVSLRVATSVDRAALVRYCEAWALSEQAMDVIREKGLTHEVTTRTGTVVRKRPEVAIASEFSKIMKSYLIEFGLTPASRAKVGWSPKKPEDDKVRKYFSGH